jgi:hypothetical protein
VPCGMRERVSTFLITVLPFSYRNNIKI